MLRIVFICMVAALGWAGYWAFASWQMGRATEAFFQDRRNAGWQADYAEITVRGFPNRLDRGFTDLTLGDPEAGWQVQVPRLGLFRLSYRAGHSILAVEGPSILRLGDTDWRIDSDGLRASMVQAGDRVQRADAEADVLNMTSEGQALALADIKAALRQTAETEYQLALTVGQVVAGGSPRAGRDLAINLTVTLDQPLLADASATEAQLRAVDIALARYQLDGLNIEATGKVTRDRLDRAAGRLDIRAVNWRDLLRAAVEADQLHPDMGSVLEAGLGLLARLQGNPNTLDIPLEFRNGETWIGPVSIGPAPRF